MESSTVVIRAHSDGRFAVAAAPFPGNRVSVAIQELVGDRMVSTVLTRDELTQILAILDGEA